MHINKKIKNLTTILKKRKLFSHISRGIDCPINSSITISFGSDDGKDFFIVLFKK